MAFKDVLNKLVSPAEPSVKDLVAGLSDEEKATFAKELIAAAPSANSNNQSDTGNSNASTGDDGKEPASEIDALKAEIAQMKASMGKPGAPANSNGNNKNSHEENIRLLRERYEVATNEHGMDGVINEFEPENKNSGMMDLSKALADSYKLAESK